MHVPVALRSLALLASAVAALPVLQANTASELIHLLGRDAHPTLNFTMSSGASVYFPDSPDWATETHRWSNWSAPTFGVAFVPATERDISSALSYLTSNNIPFLATSGGHGSTVTLASVKNGVMISLEKFQSITVNEADETITIGTGSHYRDVWVVAYNAGRELALASSCVGVGGTTVGGGHGWAQGKHGLVIDEITSMRVALWNGTIVRASSTENPDLFWAMRGAGHNFGIMLEFTLKTWPQTNGGLYYNVNMAFTDDSLEGVLGVMNDLLPIEDENLGIDFVMFTNATTKTPQLYIGMVYFGDPAKGDSYVTRFASSNKTKIERTLLNSTLVRWDELSDNAVGGFIDVACSTTTSGAVDPTVLNVDVYTVKARKHDIPLMRKLYESYKDFVRAHPQASQSTVLFEMFSQVAVRAQDASRTAYGNRAYGNILTLLQGIFTDTDVAPAVDAWARSWRDRLQKSSGYPQQHVYLNYAHGDEPLQAMYGYEPWRLDKLRTLKAKYDPHAFFSHFNPIPVGQHH
ncbi:hypothetical protein F5Y17DRAFT_82978 [Xylariaceae sp. FL0594]|nr:hypothetical protein F5Y17DRAFT_82978 [Xylariaceae sp. FL0594]